MFVWVKLCASDALGPYNATQRVGLCSCIFTASPSNEEGTLVTLVSVGLLAVGIAYVVLMALRKHQAFNSPWAMREFHRRKGLEPPRRSGEFHRRMGLEPPRRSEKLGAKDD